MIEKFEIYAICCDCCGQILHCEENICLTLGLSVWRDKNGASSEAINNGWHTDGEKYYCPTCHNIDWAAHIIKHAPDNSAGNTL